MPDGRGLLGLSGPLAARSPLWIVTLVAATALGLVADPRLGLALAAASGAGLWFAARGSAGALERAREESCELTAQLIQSQKMAALGELAAGIAHEINNPLAIITQESELLELALRGDAPDGEVLRDGVGEIMRQVRRCSDITHKMLNFARKVAPVCQPADVNRLVEDMVSLVEREAARQETRMIRVYGDLPRVITDPPLLRQVILNLLNNAVQALEHGGMIFVTTRPAGEGWIAIEVRDTGPGIPAGVADKIFNPFFTTKPPGKGTGLGLAISQRIVTGLGGMLTVGNAPDHGAVFVVRLPAVCGDDVGERPGEGDRQRSTP